MSPKEDIKPRHRRRAVLVVLISVSLILIGAIAVALSSSSQKRGAARAPVATSTASTLPESAANGASDATVIATLNAPTASFESPGGSPAGVIPPSWHSAASALPVIAMHPDWLEVRLAQRPNESTAWIHRSPDITLTETPYRIVIDLVTTHLRLYRSGELVLEAPAGIGTPADPTPTGSFFLAFFAQSPSAGYGPFVMVTSAHSDEITDWEESGDAIIAIHGPLGADSEIGTTGAAISHGCIRLHNSDLEQLRDVPAGTPIDVTA